MPLDEEKVLSLTINRETKKVKDRDKIKLSKSDKLLIFLIVSISISLFVAFILLLTNTDNTVAFNKQEKEVTTVINNIKKEEISTSEPKKTKVCVPNSPFPTEEKDVKYTCY